MKKKLFKIGFIFMSVFMFACSKTSDKNKIMHEEAAKNKGRFEDIQLVNSVDFICNMELSLGISDTAHYKGKVYGFCCKFCKKDFSEKPDYFLSKITK